MKNIGGANGQRWLMHRYGDIGVVGEVLSNRHPFANILTTS
jgi:hypothetical protein